MFSRRKGQYFEIDALIAIAILVSGLIYVKTINIEPGSFDRTQMYDRNAIKLLRTKQVGDLPINYIIALENGSLAAFTDRDFSIARQIGIYYMKGNFTSAENLSKEVIDAFIPPDYGYGVFITTPDNESVVYNRTWPKQNQDISVSKTLISGLFDEEAGIGESFGSWPRVLEVRVWN